MTLVQRAARNLALVSMLALAFILTAPQLSFADQRDFRVVNETGYSIDHLYVSPHTSTKWEEDVLGQDVLKAGQRVKITFSDSLDVCYYDIKAVYEDGDSSVKYNVDLCSISIFRFHE